MVGMSSAPFLWPNLVRLPFRIRMMKAQVCHDGSQVLGDSGGGSQDGKDLSCLFMRPPLLPSPLVTPKYTMSTKGHQPHLITTGDSNYKHCLLILDSLGCLPYHSMTLPTVLRIPDPSSHNLDKPICVSLFVSSCC